MRSREVSTATSDIRGLTEALAGAVADGVDLGPRGAQIRQLGLTLGSMIEALHIRLAERGAEVQIDGKPMSPAPGRI